MRAYHLPAKGAEPILTDLPRPTPGSGEISLRIAACGLNFADLLMIKGAYQDTPEAPFTLGMEVAGTVEALGPDTDGPAPGTRVAVFGGQGGLADYGCFPAARAVPLPDAMSFAEAAAFQVAYGTSHVALDHKARLQPGETLLVLGAAGGVGLTAVEIGKQMGARVIACARGADKLDVAKRAGADHLIDAASQDIRDTCRALGGVDVVYDPVGGDQFTAAMRACNPEARILAIGFASGDVPQIPANHLLVKNISVMGLYWGGYLKFRPEVLTQSMATLFDWYAAGRLRPHVSHLLPLEQAAEALDLLRSRKSTGKVVVTLE
ncbi:MAG: NADPH:quinone oxidoreductase family protein [Roseovarius sp.]|uniref:NADPH:quinone oxidoreductase family protein n=1 Tax=Roseovarius sp. TaxID=1486281 RepID=UPI004058D5E6